jgi:hypothetical protein
MKKSFLTAVILAAAAAFVLFAGCGQPGSDEGIGNGRGSFPSLIKSEQVYIPETGKPAPAEGNYTVKMYAGTEEGAGLPYGDVVGTLIKGQLTFTLPDLIDERGLTEAVFDYFGENYTVNPKVYKAKLLMGLAVFDGDKYIGKVTYGYPGSDIYFLYSPEPLTVNVPVDAKTGSDTPTKVAFEAGWNTFFLKGAASIVGTPPAEAKWYLAADTESKDVAKAVAKTEAEAEVKDAPKSEVKTGTKAETKTESKDELAENKPKL